MLRQMMWLSVLQAGLFASKQYNITKFYVMLNGEADRRELCSLLELSLPNKQ